MKQLLSAEQIATVERLWAAGEPLDRVCHGAGITRDLLIERRRPGDQLSHLPKRPRGVNSQATRCGDPTPAEISERTAAIRANWSETERLNRIAAPGANVDTWVGERMGGRRVSTRIPRNW